VNTVSSNNRVKLINCINDIFSLQQQHKNNPKQLQQKHADVFKRSKGFIDFFQRFAATVPLEMLRNYLSCFS